jgi:DUF2924 family protein
LSDIDSDIAALPAMSAGQLRAAWQALRCGEPMAPSSRDLLIREIAYKLQERAHGGLAPAVKRRLRALAEEWESNRAAVLAPAPLLKPGTRLLREWQGRTHTVIVLDNGFEYDGQALALTERDRAADHRGALVGAALLRTAQGSCTCGRCDGT